MGIINGISLFAFFIISARSCFSFWIAFYSSRSTPSSHNRLLSRFLLWSRLRFIAKQKRIILIIVLRCGLQRASCCCILVNRIQNLVFVRLSFLQWTQQTVHTITDSSWISPVSRPFEGAMPCIRSSLSFSSFSSFSFSSLSTASHSTLSILTLFLRLLSIRSLSLRSVHHLRGQSVVFLILLRLNDLRLLCFIRRVEG